MLALGSRTDHVSMSQQKAAQAEPIHWTQEFTAFGAQERHRHPLPPVPGRVPRTAGSPMASGTGLNPTAFESPEIR